MGWPNIAIFRDGKVARRQLRAVEVQEDARGRCWLVDGSGGVMMRAVQQLRGPGERCGHGEEWGAAE